MLRWLVSHTELPSAARWPCPECGRERTQPLRQIKKTVNRKTFYTGCWLCNMEPILEAAKAALKMEKEDGLKRKGISWKDAVVQWTTGNPELCEQCMDFARELQKAVAEDEAPT